MGRKAKPTEIPRPKGRVDLSAEEIYRLDILASHWTLERRRHYCRSDVVSELIRPHLRSIVVSVRDASSRESIPDGQE